MALLNDTKAETTPAKTIPKKVTLNSILGKFKTSPDDMPCQCHPLYYPERHPGGEMEQPRRKIKHGTQGAQQ